MSWFLLTEGLCDVDHDDKEKQPIKLAKKKFTPSTNSEYRFFFGFFIVHAQLWLIKQKPEIKLKIQV